MALDPVTTQRLAFVRFLYEQGIVQADQPEPLSATAILSFHDAVESFLLLAAEHLKINVPTGINFAQYWEKLQPGLPGQAQLPSKNPMDRMNKLRVALKHHGTIPSATAVVQTRGDVTTFFVDATSLVFGLDFARIDLIDMVARPETVKALRDAQSHADIGDYVAGLAGLSLAFQEMLDHYSGRNRHGTREAFGFGQTLHEFNRYTSPSAFDLGRESLGGVVKHVEALTNITAAMQRAMRMIALGVDYRRYAEFEVLAPKVHLYGGGSQRYTVTKAQENLTHDDYQTGKRFVIESALQMAKADTAVGALMRHLEVNQPEPGVGWTPSVRTWTGAATPPPVQSGP
ncbi:hypothetical protein [Lentzea sp. NEAU-D7]|uniref:hypothetical protein n=1 Tax=Lentzea sp. NEAU-D7 TaxID=2994667 RepID=UPI00224B60EA|nr:hypothetical protein [Lentzea sp. NEAU-D7]MCX2950836.1 hypothetical protein [Lentzea sp. NEAU-D7]